MPEISEQDLARLRRELRRANDTIERHGRTFSLIRKILQVPASNLQLMQIAGPARRVLNLLPTP